MKKMLFLSLAGAAAGITLFFACNKNAGYKLKRTIRRSRKSFDKAMHKASKKVEREMKRAVNEWELSANHR
ncbi:MAG: hypothetical protein J1E02_01400 [Coprobacter sp.]|nr:hypothetical protein [Coprobacter sp.]